MDGLESAAEYFERTAGSFTAKYLDSAEFDERRMVWRRAIEAVLPGVPEDAVCLDLGCGDGAISRFLAEQGRPIIGLDRSEAMLSLARRHATVERTGRWADYRRASLPLDRRIEDEYHGQCGVIVCSSVLEYVEDPRAVLEQCHRLLVPGGILLVSLPNRDSFYRIAQRVLGGLLARRDSYLRHQRHQYRVSDAGALLGELGYHLSETVFFALPFHRYVGLVAPRYRGRWLATMALFAAHKPRAAAEEFRGGLDG